ncbi:mitochondrial outer membrane protein porin of 34 kDa-like [Gossypium australe]|uniref:Mitochondrial outer membrane protein porin of 34 kDa-like n=1 Tax=Gossypium australe TaxID=47621 RepID=A0A5B6WUA2_9ROSI|nr:mitochondrial outer membrane protein porin of 34 kDa-like [Gossypium australe]
MLRLPSYNQCFHLLLRNLSSFASKTTIFIASKHFLPSLLLPQTLSPKHFSTPSKHLIPSLSSKPIPKNNSFSLRTNGFSSLPYPSVISATGMKKGDLFLADVNTQLKSRNVTTNIKVDTSSNLHYVYQLFTTIIVDEPPGLKAIFGFKVPNQRSGKVQNPVSDFKLYPLKIPSYFGIELQYLHECAGISSSIGLIANPIVNFLGVLGTNFLALGIDISFDTKTGNFTKRNAGLSFINADRIASLALHVVMNEKGDSVNASHYHIVNPSTNTAVLSFSTNVNTITVGIQHALDPLTTIKAQVNNTDKASTLIQHEWRPKSLFTISREVDTKSSDKSPRVELALALKP